jgi:hypothetical protein
MSGVGPASVIFCRTSRLDDRPGGLVLVALAEHPKSPKRVMSCLLLFIGPVITRLHRASGNERVEGTASESSYICLLYGREPDSYRGFLSVLSTCIVTQNGPQLDRVSAGSGPLDMTPNDCHHHMPTTYLIAHVTMNFAASGSVSPPAPHHYSRPLRRPLEGNLARLTGCVGYLSVTCSCAAVGLSSPASLPPAPLVSPRP